jgi:hypothetical protein
VVATAVGSVPSALDGGRADLLVPPSDLDALVAAMLRLTDDPELGDRLVDPGLRLARDRTLEANASRVARFIRDDVVAAADMAERCCLSGRYGCGVRSRAHSPAVKFGSTGGRRAADSALIVSVFLKAAAGRPRADEVSRIDNPEPQVGRSTTMVFVRRRRRR